MDIEELDGLLNASAPNTRTIDRIEVRAMMADAREAARPARSPRRVGAGMAAGAALALVIGGGGVAVASGLVAWPSGFEDPDGFYAFTLPSGRACEVRLIVEDRTSATDPSADDATTRAVQESVTTWLRDGGLERDFRPGCGGRRGDPDPRRAGGVLRDDRADRS
ncbi:hypothetical protein [Microbacterium sp.]|uniref:hypothetical protein n=1 Tax=Microbacterium sp. TaxID=51671 RepID=UPI0039E5114D